MGKMGKPASKLAGTMGGGVLFFLTQRRREAEAPRFLFFIETAIK